jgi:hypothetical protein
MEELLGKIRKLRLEGTTRVQINLFRVLLIWLRIIIDQMGLQLQLDHLGKLEEVLPDIIWTLLSKKVWITKLLLEKSKKRKAKTSQIPQTSSKTPTRKSCTSHKSLWTTWPPALPPTRTPSTETPRPNSKKWDLMLRQTSHSTKYQRMTS